LRIFNIHSGSNCNASYFVRKTYCIVCVNVIFHLDSTNSIYSVFIDVTVGYENSISQVGQFGFERNNDEPSLAVWYVIYIVILKFCVRLVIIIVFVWLNLIGKVKNVCIIMFRVPLQRSRKGTKLMTPVFIALRVDLTKRFMRELLIGIKKNYIFLKCMVTTLSNDSFIEICSLTSSFICMICY
jgi:hypothetical protein